MEIETTKVLTVTLKGSDADNFNTALNKIAAEQNTIGFKKTNLNDDELKVIKSLSDKVKS